MPLFTAKPLAAFTCLLVLSGCSVLDLGPAEPLNYAAAPQPVDPRYDSLLHGEQTVPAIPAQYLKDENTRQVVRYYGSEAPGTVVVDPTARFLYLVMENGEAMRYRVGVGRAGYAFEGEAVIQRKAAWPRWTPTDDMLRREPERYGKFADGVPGGYDNPLGAHALYLFRDGRDTYYRIHGTNEPQSIGNSVSAGCIRMFNQDVIDLSGRLPNGTRVVVRPSEPDPMVLAERPEPAAPAALGAAGTNAGFSNEAGAGFSGGTNAGLSGGSGNGFSDAPFAPPAPVAFANAGQ